MTSSQNVGKRRQQQRESDKKEEASSPTSIFPSLLPPISCASCRPPSLLPLSSPLCCPRPTLPFSPSVFTRLCLLPLPVSPVYEGKFIGLPGAVSWRWPPQLQPQQGFTLHMEQRRRRGLTALLPSAHMLLHSHLPLPANEHPCFLPALSLNPASLRRVFDDWSGVFFVFFSDFILLHLAFALYWSTRSR